MSTSPELPVVVASHRGPVQLDHEPDGSLRVVRGAGGLVTALLGVMPSFPDASWVCHASGPADASTAREAGGALRIALDPEGARVVGEDEVDAQDVPVIRVRPVEVEPEVHHRFYAEVSNPLLWFTQHGLYGLGDAPVVGPDQWAAFEDYVAVNEQFADAVGAQVEQLGGRALVLLHDYQLYLAPRLVRERFGDDVLISHFTHIPWPGPSAWQALPRALRLRLFEGLLGCDVVAFHTRRSARDFLLTVAEELDADVDLDEGTVTLDDGRVVRSRAYPISIDPEALREVSASRRSQSHGYMLEDTFSRQDLRLVVRIDRTDPSKNIVRGFTAFGEMLARHPEHVGRVVFLAILQPSRQDVPEYADYLGRLAAEAARVNARFRRPGYEPVDLRIQDDLPLAVAAMRKADVMLVNSVADGMNLVAKEFAVVNDNAGALVISEACGAVEELGEQSWVVSPTDVAGTADALHEALSAARSERARRLDGLRSVVEAGDVQAWMDAQLADLLR